MAPEIERLYRDHRAGLVRLVERELHDRHDAEDAVQTAFLDAQCALERGTIPRNPRAWLAAIALNAGRRLRRRRLNAEPLEEYAVQEASGVPEINAALESLPREQRTAVVYRDMLGLSYGETAEQMGTSINAVTMLLHRGRRRLRQTLGVTTAGIGLWRWGRRLGMPQVAVAKGAATVLVAAGLATTGIVAARAVAPVGTEAAAAAAPVAQAHAPANALAVHSARHHHKAAGRSSVTAAPASTPESGEAATPASVPSPTTAATPSPSPSPSTVGATTAVPVPTLPIPTTPPAVTVSTPVATVTVTIPTVTTTTVTTPIVTVTVPIP